jgi:hypothetical protein
MISWVSDNQQREVGKLGKEVELEEDQVLCRRLAPLVLCSEPALEWMGDHTLTLLLVRLVGWREVGLFLRFLATKKDEKSETGVGSSAGGGPGISHQQSHRPQVKVDCRDDSVLKCQLKQLERSKSLMVL